MDTTAVDRRTFLSHGRRAGSRPSTDLEEAGLVERYLEWPRRDWLLTIDLEAFTPGTAAVWTHAMDAWAEQSDARGHRFSVFVSVEDLVRLRLEDDAAYRAFT